MKKISRPFQFALAAAIVGLAALLRVRGALNDLWLDEIWSLAIVQNLSSPLEIFTKLHHENNQYLNTLWLYFLGPHGNWPGYRAASVLFGMGSVIVAGLIGRRRSVATGFFTLSLTAVSYFSVLYSSEARGYAAAIFFSYLCFYLLDIYLESRRGKYAGLFSICAVFGLLAHLTFLNCLLAAGLWTLCRLAKAGASAKQIVSAMLATQALPVAFFALLYWIDLRHLQNGGGTSGTLSGRFAASLGWAVGLPHADTAEVFSVLVAVILFGGTVWWLRRELPGSGWFFAGVIVIFPVLLVCARHSSAIYVRYFIVGMAFILILLGYLLAGFFERGGGGRAVALLLLAGYLGLNGWQIGKLFRYGRGQYPAAARFLADHSLKSPITIGAIGNEQDFRTPFVLQFYAPKVMPGKAVDYCPRNYWPPGGPEWLIQDAESFLDPIPQQTHFTDDAGHHYELVKTFPTAPLSGLHWFLYHNQTK